MTTHGKGSRAELLQQAIRLKKAAAGSRMRGLARRPADQPTYLGEMQRSLWLAHQLDPRSAAYNLTDAFRLQGSLDVEALQRAFNQLVSRHRILRSTFRSDRDAIFQDVHPHKPLAIEVHQVEDGGGLAAAAHEARRPFDLEAGPLVRLRLIEEKSNEQRFLLLVLHHILVDERSLDFFWHELADAYRGQLPEAPVEVQYDDYVYASRHQGVEVQHRDLEHWRQRLDPLPEVLRLPFEKAAGEASEADGSGGRLLGRSLGDASQQGVRRLAAATGSTPFMACAFAFR